MKYLKARYFTLGLAIAFLICWMSMSVRLMTVKARVPVPQAIFVLGGGENRELFAAEFAHQHPELKVWISSGAPPDRKFEIFQAAGVSLSRLEFDYLASDTVTNFTTIAERFAQRQIEHVYLVTSDFHMRRARSIAFFVFGSRGIVCTSVMVPSHKEKESVFRILRDIVRSLLWLLHEFITQKSQN